MLFDTSVVIDVLRKRRQYEYGAISVVTLLEIVRGIGDGEMAEVLILLRQLYQVYDMDDAVILTYSKLYQGLKAEKKRLADVDMIIAATAHAKGEKLYTKDRDFEVVKELIDVAIV